MISVIRPAALRPLEVFVKSEHFKCFWDLKNVWIGHDG